MKNSIIALFALAATATAELGQAIVENSCSYPVALNNTPAAGGGYSEDDHVLESGETYTQTWITLENDIQGGWSIKLWPVSAGSANMMQYEYTLTSNASNTIWYDLSDVNGNPWNANWMISTESAGCSPKQQAYRNATDDAYGEQSCPSGSTIMVTLCSGNEAASSGSSSSSVPAYTSTSISSKYSPTASAPTSVGDGSTTVATTIAPVTTIPTTTVSNTVSYSHYTGRPSYGIVEEDDLVASPTSATTATTLQTSVVTSAVASTTNGGVITVTEVTTAIAYHTIFPSKAKRVEHVHEHAAHHARHPHGAPHA